jgi:hypothetical protein
VDVCGVLTFEWVAVLQQGKAWMLQLLSVACLSLAAKMEETEVPILLDLQVFISDHLLVIVRGFIAMQSMQCEWP